jgi:glycolate oxidase FAD binding subunit
VNVARPQDLGAALAAVVGADAVRTGEAARAWTVAGRAPGAVVWPRSIDAVARCLELAHAERLAVVPTGQGTRLHWGGPPSRLDVVLSVARLDGVLAHEPADLTASVEAGVTLSQLNAALAPHGQRLPLDPPRAQTSTVGGLIATAASGPYRARYGTMREALLGVTVVQADGTVTQGGGRVVKNVTGYDMPKLHVGALGTLGVVVAAHLRLQPVPAVEQTWLFEFESAEAALDSALQVLDAALTLSRVELLDGGALAALAPGRAAGAGVAVTVGSVPEAVRAQGGRIEDACRRSGGHVVSLAEPDAWWRAVADLSWPAGPADLALRIGSRATDVVKALRALEAARDPGAAGRATAEVANGVLHAVVGGPAALAAPAWLPRLRESLAGLEATVVVEHAPAECAAALDVWGDAGPALGLMRALKGELDPRGVLNPGRFVGGI